MRNNTKQKIGPRRRLYDWARKGVLTTFGLFVLSGNASAQQNNNEHKKTSMEVVDQKWNPGMYRLVVTKDLKLDEKSLKITTTEDEELGIFTADNGIALLNHQGNGSYAILENGKIDYYMYFGHSKVKCDDDKDKTIKEFMNISYQENGNLNSSFSKILKENSLTETKQRLQNKQPSRTVISDYSLSIGDNAGTAHYSTRQQKESNADASYIYNLVPPVIRDQASGNWKCGDIVSPRGDVIQTVAIERVKQLVETLPLCQQLQEKAKTQSLSEEEKLFVKNHTQGMNGMGLYQGEDGKVHQKTPKTLDTTTLFIQSARQNQ